MQTFMRKSAQCGWRATTEIHLPAISDNTYLEVNTYKRSTGGLVTWANVITKEGCFNVSTPFSNKSGMIFMNMIERVTEKAVKKQHDEALKIIDGYVKRAIEFHQKKAA
jgi:hypothetical protein